jgi:mannose-1-phosphate guanylyltransferase/mannose-6-phosphate isomerase
MDAYPAMTTAEEREDAATHVYPVILCGGSGKRLWPISRSSYPKQFLRLLSDHTMLQETAKRAFNKHALEAPIVVCNDSHRFHVIEQFESVGIPLRSVLCEPTGRNTAPALAAAALMLFEQDPSAVMLVLPSDHHIGDKKAYANAVSRAVKAAGAGMLATFGIPPTRPETGYGYIKRGDPLDGVKDVYKVAQFIEKPDAQFAACLAADKSCYWNSGMFVFPVAEFLEELRRYSPRTVNACEEALKKGCRHDDGILLDADSFAAAPNTSIDVALMEVTDKAAVVEANIEWSDVGSWHALCEIKQADENGNMLEGNVTVDGVRNAFIRSDDRLVAAIGLENIIVVDTKDALLVSGVEHAHKIGRMVQRLDKENRPELSQHPQVYRPWGYYQSIDCGGRFQVKHIMVKPGAQLSLQMHHHRAEHWIVVSGTALVSCGDETRLLSENESTYIPLGTSHRLENPGKILLHLIEVQVGPYLGEDDIVRFEDTYGRA